MKILVVGGAGYIGSHAVRRLVADGNDVVVLDSLFTGHKEAIDPKAKFYQVDLLDKDAVTDLLKKEKIEAVMHFAAYSLVGESVKKPLKYYKNNASGMISLLEAMEETGVKYLVFSSSAATYGIPESCQSLKKLRLTINPYGETKMMMERSCTGLTRLTDQVYRPALLQRGGCFPGRINW